MEVKTVYMEVEVNRFNIFWPTQGPDTTSDFPFSNWVLQWDIRGKPLQKILFLLFPFLEIMIIAEAIDLGIWLFKKIIEGIFFVLKIFFESFGRRFFGILGIAIIGFLIFVIIRSGQWEKLYDTALKLFE